MQLAQGGHPDVGVAPQPAGIHENRRESANVTGVENGRFNSGDAFELPFDVGDVLDDRTLDFIAMGETVEENLAVFPILFGIVTGEHAAFCCESVANCVPTGGGFSFRSDRSGGKESVGLIGCELRCSHVVVPATQ